MGLEATTDFSLPEFNKPSSTRYVAIKTVFMAVYNAFGLGRARRGVWFPTSRPKVHRRPSDSILMRTSSR